jgi:hypothetical protein
MSSWMTCGSQATARTATAPVVAWDDIVDRSVTAWTHHDRSSESTNRQIRVSVGNIANNVLPAHDVVAGPVVASPGVACRYTAGNSSLIECVAAYVLQSEPTYTVRVTTFAVDAATNRYVAVPFVTNTTTAKSASRLSVTWNSDTSLYYLVVKLADVGQYLRVWTSPTGTTWTLDNSVLSTNIQSAVGPVSVPYWTNDENVLTYVN